VSVRFVKTPCLVDITSLRPLDGPGSNLAGA
jgi:hypothetical protein